MSYKIVPDIRLANNKKSYEVWYTDSKGEVVLHKKGLSLDDANKESVALRGYQRLWNELFKKAK
jgi:hypothetical protein